MHSKKVSKNEDRKPRTKKQRVRFFLIVGIIVSCAVIWLGLYVWHWEHRAHVLEVHSLLVDGTVILFIRTPENRTILVDSGKTDAIIRSLTSLMPFYRHHIDTVVLTKDDDAHVTGLVDVLQRYDVGQVIEMASVQNISTTSSAASATSSAYDEFEKLISEKKIIDHRFGEGDSVSFGDPEVLSQVFFPAASSTYKYSKTNIPMLAFQIKYGSTAIIVSDLTKTEQKYIASSSILFASSSILVSSHAGGAGAEYEGLFDAINPAYVVIAKKPSSPPKSSKSVVVVPGKKLPKPKKPVFGISDAANTKIVNLIDQASAVFISDGRVVRGYPN